MGLYVIKMPDIGEGIAEVELVQWHVQPGDAVVEDQVLADVMTDKATVEIPSPVAGKVVSLGGKVGDVMVVGTELIRLEVEGVGNVAEGAPPITGRAPASRAAAPANATSAVTSAAAAAPAEAAPGVAAPAAGGAPAVRAEAGATKRAAAAPGGAAPVTAAATAVATASGAAMRAAAPGTATPAAAGATAAPAARGAARAAAAATAAPAAAPVPRAPGEKPIASPAVRRRAWELGIELRFVPGSGTGGRILHEDLDAYLAGRRLALQPGSRYVERHDEQQVQVIGLRRKIAQKMQEAKRRIPHFTYVEEIDVTELEALRAQLNAQHAASRGKLTLLPLLARAMVLALAEFPQINARYDDDAGVVTRYGAVHLGIATQTDGGLMVPVLRHAEARDLWATAAEIARLAEAARSGRATREELTGSTITVTSLGALGGIVTTPVINWPEVAIVGVGRIVERPVVLQGRIVARKLMNLSSSFDHRVVDGADGAQFVQALRRLLQSPALLFVD